MGFASLAPVSVRDVVSRERGRTWPSRALSTLLWPLSVPSHTHTHVWSPQPFKLNKLDHELCWLKPHILLIKEGKLRRLHLLTGRGKHS